MTTKAPPKPAPRPSTTGQAPQPSEPTAFKINRGVSAKANKIVIYGPGGVGKSELASLIQDVGVEPLFIDLEEGTKFLDVARAEDDNGQSPQTLEQAIEAVRMARSMPEFGAIVIDSFTKAEELAKEFTIRTVKHQKKDKVIKSIDDYGYGSGLTHVFDSFQLLLNELDAAIRFGKHVIAICHECTATAPNPMGDEWIRYEPRLQSPKSGKDSIRHRVKEWSDHLLFVNFDTFVGEDGKGQGGQTRTIYPTEMATHWAKSRCLSDTIAYEKGDAELWRQLLNR